MMLEIPVMKTAVDFFTFHNLLLFDISLHFMSGLYLVSK